MKKSRWRIPGKKKGEREKETGAERRKERHNGGGRGKESQRLKNCSNRERKVSRETERYC